MVWRKGEIMPKLKNHPPKLSKSGNYAYVYLNGDRLSMGRYGSKEADQDYRRFIAEWASSSRTATLCPGKRASVMEVVCAYTRLGRNEHRPPGLQPREGGGRVRARSLRQDA
ncbi:MAG TPA: hypothetical protein DEB39_00355, partial [Planctomycetaceae bacterium]|nr:hypothetical protein [Planctomycetaceae bacterium]